MLLNFWIYFLIIYLISGLGVSFFYHRFLTHRTHTVNPWFEKIFIFIALPAGTPIQWVGTHLKHHKYTDEIGDPHSPNVDGFLFAHCGWYINQKNQLICLIYAFGGSFRMLFDTFWRPRNGLENNHYAKRLQENSVYSWVSKPLNYTLLMLLYQSILISTTLLIFGVFYGLLFLYISLLLVYNMGDAVNSFGHTSLFSKKLSEKTAQNKTILTLITFGEGKHREHHIYPSKFLMNNTKFSLSKLILYLMEKLNIVKPNRL